MLVRDVMQSRLVTVTPKTTLPQAMRLAAERRIRHLPVVDDGELVGIVSDRDLKQAMASPATSLEVHELNYLLSGVRRLVFGSVAEEVLRAAGVPVLLFRMPAPPAPVNEAREP